MNKMANYYPLKCPEFNSCGTGICECMQKTRGDYRKRATFLDKTRARILLHTLAPKITIKQIKKLKGAA